MTDGSEQQKPLGDEFGCGTTGLTIAAKDTCIQVTAAKAPSVWWGQSQVQMGPTASELSMISKGFSPHSPCRDSIDTKTAPILPWGPPTPCLPRVSGEETTMRFCSACKGQPAATA